MSDQVRKKIWMVDFHGNYLNVQGTFDSIEVAYVAGLNVINDPKCNNILSLME